MTERLSSTDDIPQDVAEHLLRAGDLSRLPDTWDEVRRLILRRWITEGGLHQKQDVLELFDEQMNMSQYLEEIQDNQKYFSKLRARLARQSPESEHDLPALLVIPSGSTEALMKRINLNGTRGYTSLDQADIGEFYPTTIFPHVVTGVELNSDRTAQTPREVRVRYEYSPKRPLTLNEGVALLTYYPEILYTASGICLPGSTHREYGTLGIYRYGDRPRLKRVAASGLIDPNSLVPICDRNIISTESQ